MYLRSKKFAQQFFYPVLPDSLSMHMLLRFAQRCCGLLAALMCILLLGPIAVIIAVGRILRSWYYGLPADYRDLGLLLPQFICTCIIVGAVTLAVQSLK